MPIKLERSPVGNYFDGNTQHGEITLCAKVLTIINPKITKLKKATLFLSDTAARGYRPVNLSQGFGRIWSWEIPSLGMVDRVGDPTYVFGFDDSKITKILFDLTEKSLDRATIWIRLTR